MSNFYQRKLYALLRTYTNESGIQLCHDSDIFTAAEWDELDKWWESKGHITSEIASSSDRLNFEIQHNNSNDTELRHPISGQKRTLDTSNAYPTQNVAQKIKAVFEKMCEQHPRDEAMKRLFIWCWRFLPSLMNQLEVPLENAFLTPAHLILPDCPQHSYSSTVSALTGAMFPYQWNKGDSYEHPYLLLFTFSPVQEIIKASRKFLDFWGGSYLLHYLSAILCWEVAQIYGTDAVITPSLWSQEIIDALIIKEYPEFKDYFGEFDGKDNDPCTKFSNKTSTSLSTAGFPNTITVLVPNKVEAIALGEHLKYIIKYNWSNIALKVRNHVKKSFIDRLRINEKVVNHE